MRLCFIWAGVWSFSDEKKLENLIVRISYHKASDHRKKAFRKYEYANSDAILEMTDMRVRKGNRVDEIVLNTGGSRIPAVDI